MLHEKYVKNWYIKKNSFLDGKLTTYFKLKQNFGFERYLSYTKNFEYRRSMCKLRISAHKSNIEVGRYNKTPRNERFCKKCNTDEIEDEMHFLLLCNHFETDRNNILDLVAGEVKNFHTLSCENKFIS